ncbi:hypothetical protein B0H10DRAFT_117494 [Mycena sp. CBHHK59/15]|nr:hypothetical protein B0H10DRAFT_117494 [Mycena sp. CBHHK59/15]
MYFSSAKSRQVLGYEPEVGADEGIQKTMAVCFLLISFDAIIYGLLVQWFKPEAEMEAGNQH